MQSENLIIVSGVAHSGTTIITHILQQHPDIKLLSNGNEAWLLENDYLPNEQTENIERELKIETSKRLLMKRPWNFVWHLGWLRSQMPNAYYINCKRDFEDISVSWRKLDSLVDCGLKYGDTDMQKRFYNMCEEQAMKFSDLVPHFRNINHKEFVNNPSKNMNEIVEWLGLSAFDFDVSDVSFDKNIKQILPR